MLSSALIIHISFCQQTFRMCRILQGTVSLTQHLSHTLEPSGYAIKLFSYFSSSGSVITANSWRTEQ